MPKRPASKPSDKVVNVINKVIGGKSKPTTKAKSKTQDV